MLARCAGHLGLRDPDVPLVGRAVSNPSPTQRIAALAEAGFGAAFDNFLCLRSDEWVDELAAACAAQGLPLTSFVHDPLRWNTPVWLDGSALDALPRSLAVARRTGARVANCVTAPLPGAAHGEQLARFAQNLRAAAEQAEGSGMVLAVEATHPRFAPGLLVERLDDALAVVAMADHPGVRLMLDLGHVALHGEDPAAAVRKAAPWIGAVQLADAPGRGEPGSGSVDWRAVIAALEAARWTEWLEIECEPSASEALLLERLAALGS